jgi:heptose I phosphotransferase
MIDLHRLGRHPWTWRLWQLKDLAQLLYSSDVPGVTARDCLRFWRYYQGPQRHRRLLRFLASCIRLKARRYQRHNAKRAKVSKGDPLNGQPK